MKKISVLLPLLLCIAASSSSAFDFSEADRLFSLREGNLQNIASARAIYQRALHEAHGDELIYAVEHLGKLAYYEGDLLTDESDSSRRVEIFQQCQDDVDTLSPDKAGTDIPVYYYWKSVCTALWGKSANPFSVLTRFGELKRLMQKGMEVAPDYASGGMYRVGASIYIRSKALRYIPGLSELYNPNKALDYVNKAISLGPDYYLSYLLKAEIMKELGQKDAAVTYLTSKKGELESRVRRNALPKGLEPESKKILEQMTKLLASW